MRRMIFTIPALFAGVSALAAPVVDLDFSRAETGEFPNKCKPGESAVARFTVSAYGRLKGETALENAKKRYGTAAMDRQGRPRAFRLGNAGNYLENLGFAPETGKPFTVELWFNVYPQESYFGGNLMNANMGYQKGFRIDFGRAKWAKDGMFVLNHGTDAKEGSHSLRATRCLPGEWHQLVLVSTGKTIAAYLDGKKLGENADAVKFETRWAQLNIGARAEPWTNKGTGLDYKIDGVYVDNTALPVEEIAKRYEAGKPASTVSDADFEAASFELPAESGGYFTVNQPIPLKFKGGDKLLLDGKPAPQELKYNAPGRYTVQLAIEKNGKIVKEQRFTFGIVAALPTASKIGSVNAVEQTPESSRLGCDYDRVVADWTVLEPKKQEYDWSTLDEIVKRNDAAKRKTVICLTGIPHWLGRDKADRNLPADMERYRKIWRLLVSRYDQINHFEVWHSINWHNALQGGPDERIKSYTALLKVAAPAIRGENENAKILIGGIREANGVFLSKLIAAIPADQYDIVSIQDDSVRTGDTGVWEHAVKTAKKPVWNTSCGSFQSIPGGKAANSYPVRTVEDKKSGAEMVRNLAAQLGAGVERIFLFAGPSSYFPIPNGELRNPGWKGVALAQFNREIGPEAKLEKIAGTPGAAAFRYTNPNGRAGVIAFALKGSASLKVPAGTVKMIDLYGQESAVPGESIPLTESPIYLIAKQ